MSELTPKQAMFVKEYLIDLNGTQAAIRAGYSPSSAYSIAEENMRKPEVAEAIQAAMDQRGKRTGITADRVLAEIERLALFDPADLINVKCPQDIADLPEDQRRAITGWKWDKDGNFIITMVKQGALEMLGRHHKLFTDKVDLSNSDGNLRPAAPVYNIVQK